MVQGFDRRGVLRAREGGEQRVTPLELFFDLVFVFAITQVTAFMAKDPTWEGLGRGLLILAVIWWAWAAYAWLTDTLDTEEDRVRLVMFAAMGAMFIAALAIPHAFNDDALIFAVAYGGVRIAHLLLYAYAANDEGVRAAVIRLGPSVAIAVALLVAASFLDGPAQGALWALAHVFMYVLGLVYAVAIDSQSTPPTVPIGALMLVAAGLWMAWSVLRRASPAGVAHPGPCTK